MATTIPVQLLVEEFDRFAIANDFADYYPDAKSRAKYARLRAKLDEIITEASR